MGLVSICWAGLLAGNVEEIIQERGWTRCHETWGVQASIAKRAGTKTKPTRRRTSSCWSGWVRQRTCKILNINYAGVVKDTWMTSEWHKMALQRQKQFVSSSQSEPLEKMKFERAEDLLLCHLSYM